MRIRTLVLWSLVVPLFWIGTGYLTLAVVDAEVIRARAKLVTRALDTFPFKSGVIERGPALTLRMTPTIFTMGACSSQQDCQDTTDEQCSEAGHGGVQADTVIITLHDDGAQTCSGECVGGCNSNGCPVALTECRPGTIVDDPDPVGWDGRLENIFQPN